MVVIYALMAAIVTQTSNLIAVKLFDLNQPVFSALKIACYTLPLAFMATIFFNMYYGSGHSSFSYSTLNVIAIALSVSIGVLVHLILGSKPLSFYEIIGCSFIVIGVAVIVANK